MAFLTHNLGLGTTIVQVLRHYGKVPVDFLVDRLNHERSEVEEYLNLLESKGSIHREGDRVELVDKPTKQ